MRRIGLTSRAALALWLCASACSDDDFPGVAEAGRPNLDDESGGETTSDADASSSGVESVALELGALSYHLDWEALEPGPVTGAAWEVETDLGYRVRVHAAWTTVYGMSLIPCELGAAELDEVGFLAWLSAPFTVSTAYAGHSGENDPSADYARRVEDLSSPQPIDYGEVDFAAAAYCQFHFVYGPAGIDTAGLPPDTDIVGKSLALTGSWQAPDEETWNEFSIHASHANGKIIDFGEARLGAIGERTSFRLFRDWRRAFDEIDFDTVSQWELDLAVLDNLVASARLEIGEF